MQSESQSYGPRCCAPVEAQLWCTSNAAHTQAESALLLKPADLVTNTALLARLCCVFWCTCKCHGYSALGSATCIAVLDAAALHACALLQVVRRQAAQHGLAPLVHERTWGENLLGNATIALRMCAVSCRTGAMHGDRSTSDIQQSASETKPPIISSDVLHPSNITTLPLIAA